MTTIDRDNGVTPFSIRCRHPVGKCDGLAYSFFYKGISEFSIPVWEWYRPETLEEIDPRNLDHVMKGGLLLREIPNPLAGR